ncbi:glycosyltransferase family 2 protein [Cyclobacterium roseum]|uniref:glycosyltransferase family 2 protein n=1 Tax=Cyclobacterium roseum TaxID=2666137 RepID=UPI001391C1F3|nr:glycosyltransferase family 2 protein [Cyclobacterium roseum]
MKQVSVIIPVFNNQKTLERAIFSVLNDPLVSEVIIVDDGSTDGSYTLSQELAEKFPAVCLLAHRNRENKGAAASRNLALTKAKSNWIQFLDADDELINGKLEGQINLVSSEIAFVVGNSVHVFPDGRGHNRTSDKYIWKGLIRSKLGDTCSNLWNKKYLLMVGGWNENLSSSQEYELMFRLVTRQPNIVYDRRYLTLIHKTENSISTDPNKKMQRISNWLDLRNRIRRHLIENGQFHLYNKCYWSGAVGIFCDQNQMDFPITVNKVMYKMYKIEISIKKNIYNLFKLNE